MNYIKSKKVCFISSCEKNYKIRIQFYKIPISNNYLKIINISSIFLLSNILLYTIKSTFSI